MVKTTVGGTQTFRTVKQTLIKFKLYLECTYPRKQTSLQLCVLNASRSINNNNNKRRKKEKKEKKKKKKRRKEKTEEEEEEEEEEVSDPSSNHFPQIPSLYSHCLMAVRYTW